MVRLEETRKNEKTRRIIVGERARLEKRGHEKRSEWETGARGFGGGRGMGGLWVRHGSGSGEVVVGGTVDKGHSETHKDRVGRH